MPLTRALLALFTAVALSLASSLVIAAMAEEGPSPTQVADVLWVDRPKSVEELAADSTALVEARVTAIEEGPDLLDSTSTAEEGIPTQRIAFETVNVLDGQIPSTFKLFKTGSPEIHLQGDPFYAIGESYVLFLEPQGEPGTWIPAAPDGRIELDARGEADPVIAGPVATELEGQTPEEIEEAAE